jgi:hypothetical protein
VIKIKLDDLMLRRAAWSLVDGIKTYFVRADVYWSVVRTSHTSRAVKLRIIVNQDVVGEDTVGIAT